LNIQISYMGTKKWLATQVSNLINQYPGGIFFDAFSGMCSVGQALDNSRSLWTNDIQKFPALVAKTLFCSKACTPDIKKILSLLQPRFEENYGALFDLYKKYINKEKKYLKTQKLTDVIEGNNLPYVGNNDKFNEERDKLSSRPTDFPYKLFTITYSGSYFGIVQSVEIDSIRYAIDIIKSQNFISEEIHGWLIVALGQAISRVNNSTGQFAHYLKPKGSNINRIVNNRKKSVWVEFENALATIKPLKTKAWRYRNRAFCDDTLSLLEKIKSYKKKPSIIYADPPYSEAQYSRYYHVFETLLEYNYPMVKSVGRYPENRYQAPFSNISTVSDSMISLVRSASQLNAILLLSYPDNGIFYRNGKSIFKLLKEFYSKVKLANKIMCQHSTFGGRWAKPKIQVNECIYTAQN